MGFAAGITDWSPGGFKWFNDYSRELSQLVWLNFQLNVTAGGGGGWGCAYDRFGRPFDCHDYRHFGGNALELGAGVKLKWRVRAIPLQIHAKLGGVLDFLWLNYPSDGYWGTAFGFRGGAGVRYFFVPTFGLGAELVHTIGPAIINHDVGGAVYATIDFNIGVEWRF